MIGFIPYHTFPPESPAYHQPSLTGDSAGIKLKNNTSEVIDIDDMELEAFYESIEKSVTVHYKNLIKK